MIGKQTIVVEDRLKEIFDQIPTITGADNIEYAPVFKVGDRKELLGFFSESTGKTNYPLIWLDAPYEEEHLNRKRVKIENMNLILAVETSAEMRYSERIDLTFKARLYPLLDRVIDMFIVANTVTFDLNYEITKFGNYSETDNGDGSVIPDLWDAIKLTFDVEINDTCLRTIKI